MSFPSIVRRASVAKTAHGLRRLHEQAGLHDDWNVDLSDPLRLVPSRERCRRVAFHTKWSQLAGILKRQCEAAKGTLVVSRYGLLPAPCVRVVMLLAQKTSTTVRFVGDLDPLDLTVYLCLAFGGVEHLARETMGVAAEYAGIDDGWLANAEADLRPHWRRPARVRYPGAIKMTDFERDGIAWLFECFEGWEHVIGPRCVELLTSGWKIELEGISNPALFRTRFFRPALERHFLRVPESRAQ